MKNEELIEKLAVIMDRLDRIERKVDDLKNYVPPTYPSTSPQIWYKDNKIIDFDKITCTNEDYIVKVEW